MKTQNSIQMNRFPSWILSTLFILFSCSTEEDVAPKEDEIIPEVPELGIDVAYLPVVVHVVHLGEDIGHGTNLSDARILRQIEILNEDFRRKANTRGFNNHPDGADSKIEFVLAKTDPDGNPTNGINRIDQNKINVPSLGYNQNHYAQYAYWNSSQYINIWTTPLPESAICLALGISSAPDTDLPGTELLLIPGPNDKEGILINHFHFGESDIDCHARYGRTLTHEMGHYLGLLHTWAGNDCENNDYCEDTPAVDQPVYNIAFVGCKGETAQVNNYMTWSDDQLMNMFTHDQMDRMHYVLKNHKGRNALLSSPGIR
ncbi:Pregnancy-associated plasma protein-A [Reichenbachiella faecimaris]|uniref:Pregnancy-associated plasma protein-A n=1 Tax=Reichenbachiella faecimaris TaxID=692418 RepID=A0A1W2G739_REIFA|nr:M43 family zinc metalloprotease [Reichenbachiella faecimaris]SMD32252.1 Pregnancy-associated plasma protein-A [Reichenbachiella faecimaris]